VCSRPSILPSFLSFVFVVVVVDNHTLSVLILKICCALCFFSLSLSRPPLHKSEDRVHDIATARAERKRKSQLLLQEMRDSAHIMNFNGQTFDVSELWCRQAGNQGTHDDETSVGAGISLGLLRTETFELRGGNPLWKSLGLKNGMPSGFGECCAPKLLNYAARKRLKPLSLVEIWWGKSPPGGGKVGMQAYASCSDKCSHILGFSLCGHQ
jgi:hypothetical protein